MTKIEPLEVPDGCLEIPGFIVPIISGTPAWLTIDGKVTTIWQDRGVWETSEAANDAVIQFCR